MIDPDTLRELNPDVICISSFFDNNTDNFQRECLALGLDMDAVRATRIYAHPYPNWDFGSPRWILGLMYMANVLHPQLFPFDVFKEAQIFYRATSGGLEMINLRRVGRPMGRPSLVRSTLV